MDFFKRTWCEIDLDALENNFMEVKRLIGKNTKIMSVVKADAYGHGVRYIAKKLEKMGTDWFAVSNIEEGVQIRQYDVRTPILILGYTPYDRIKKACDYDISQTVFSYEYGKYIAQECKRHNIKIKVHFKIDTGMNRIGFLCRNKKECENTAKQIGELLENKELVGEGIFTHFSSSDDLTDADYTRLQYNNFMEVIHKLDDIGIKLNFRHCCNSAGIINYPDMHLDMVRAGIVLYGLHPSNKEARKTKFFPVMSLKTIVSQVKHLPRGSSVSYNRKYISTADKIVATVPIGYADGYSSKFSNKACMIIKGKRAKVLGKVCMDQTILDVSDIENVQEGDIVTVFGNDGDSRISVDELVKYMDTINYELICLIGKRVTRIYTQKNSVISKNNDIFGNAKTPHYLGNI